ncbi:MAG: hypothetical protein GY814_02895 [Gammaproteobacteria bacterium]|nr:hypothetical protein [Gammaproteobacteria bacterium]
MFQNRIVQVPTADIQINRAGRQRSELTFDSILDLAVSIGNSQWICPILIDQDTNSIIAGERRLTAVKALCAAVNGDYSGFTSPDEARVTLAPICSCNVDSWSQWTRIPAQLGHQLTEKDLSVYEFIENAQRQGLSWQDRAKAVYVVHAHGLQEDREWSNTKTGNLIGLDHSTVAKNLKVWRIVLSDTSAEVKLIISESPTLNSATQNLTRYISRRQDDVVSLGGKATQIKAMPTAVLDSSDLVSLAGTPGPEAGAPQPNYLHEHEDEDGPDGEDGPWAEGYEERTAPLSLGERLLVNADFHEWAANYTGPAFNFLHCDFPYGINFNKGPQTSTIMNKLSGDYDDSPDIYWELLETLATHQDKLIAESAHILFWFSQNFRQETEDFFTEHFPGVVIQGFPLIWHCSDFDGIVPDPQRYGRRTYETAMVLTFGDRHIVTPKSLSFAAPRGSKTRHHRSQKPQTVLNHFMSMFVDPASTVLDPTAGSGTSLLAAHQLHAKTIRGVEKEEQTYQTALTFLNKREDTISL